MSHFYLKDYARFYTRILANETVAEAFCLTARIAVRTETTISSDWLTDCRPDTQNHFVTLLTDFLPAYRERTVS